MIVELTNREREIIAALWIAWCGESYNIPRNAEFEKFLAKVGVNLSGELIPVEVSA